MSQSFRPVKEIWNAHSSCFVEPEELIMLRPKVGRGQAAAADSSPASRVREETRLHQAGRGST